MAVSACKEKHQLTSVISQVVRRITRPISFRRHPRSSSRSTRPPCTSRTSSTTLFPSGIDRCKATNSCAYRICVHAADYGTGVRIMKFGGVSAEIGTSSSSCLQTTPHAAAQAENHSAHASSPEILRRMHHRQACDKSNIVDSGCTKLVGSMTEPI